ncbi:LysR family transcriptional regulator [Vibrio sp. CB1-14]|uniref:LysR family transcriptional regulator n=1 Tax=Vibrio chaetopteri TaxID=3016528 RepID=A0AAU8BT67_9VIBR
MDKSKLIGLLHEMAVFVEVIEQGGFAKAAKVLGCAPSSVSRTIHRLEASLNEKLIERSTRHMALTPVGKKVHMHCLEMLGSAKNAVFAAQSEQEDICGSLRVAAPKALSRQVLMPIVLDFAEAYPNVDLHFKVADHFIDPMSDEVDVLIQITNSPKENLVATSLGQCRLILCASPAYVERIGMPSHPDKLSEHNCLCLGENPRDKIWSFSSNRHSTTVDVKGSFAVNHSEIRREAVLRGLGVSVFPEFAVQSYIDNGTLVPLLADWHVSGNYQGKIIAQYVQSKYIPRQLRAFVDYVKSGLDNNRHLKLEPIKAFSMMD